MKNAAEYASQVRTLGLSPVSVSLARPPRVFCEGGRKGFDVGGFSTEGTTVGVRSNPSKGTEVRFSGFVVVGVVVVVVVGVVSLAKQLPSTCLAFASSSGSNERALTSGAAGPLLLRRLRILALA